MIRDILKNLFIMGATIVVVLGGFYLVLKCLDWGLRRKSGGREQEGLTALWIASQTQQPTESQIGDDPPPADPTEKRQS